MPLLINLLQRARYGWERLIYGDPKDRWPVEDRLLDYFRTQPSSAAYAAFQLRMSPGAALAAVRRLRRAGRIREAAVQPPITRWHPRLKPRFVIYEPASS